MYTLDEIAALRKKCGELELEGRELLEKYSDSELQAICNGIGPDGAPLLLRRMLNKLHTDLEPASMIHDVEFRESDGMESTFKESNDRFLANGIKISLRYKWFDLRRYLLQLQISRLAAWCRTFGIFFWRLGALGREKESV